MSSPSSTTDYHRNLDIVKYALAVSYVIVAVVALVQHIRTKMTKQKRKSSKPNVLNLLILLSAIGIQFSLHLVVLKKTSLQ